MAKCPRCAETFFDPCPYCRETGSRNLGYLQRIEILCKGLSVAKKVHGPEGEFLTLAIDDIWKVYQQPGEAEEFFRLVMHGQTWLKEQNAKREVPYEHEAKEAK